MIKNRSSYVCSVSFVAFRSDVLAIGRKFGIPCKVYKNLLNCDFLELRRELFDLLRAYFKCSEEKSPFGKMLSQAFFSGELDGSAADYLFVKIYNIDEPAEHLILNETFAWDSISACWF